MNNSRALDRHFGSCDPRFRKSYLLLFSLYLCVALVSFSCGSKPTDLRALAPADALIYIETNDLGAALQPIVQSKGFNDAAISRPNLSAISGVQLAIAVTGFETAEEKVSNEGSILEFKPHFVAIADTHGWQWQTNSFAEDYLGEFINRIYGGGVQLSTASKDSGTEYVWTAEDGRKAYALVTGSLIFFGNDGTSIERVQAVRRGEARSIGGSGKLSPYDASMLSYGYVSTDGIAQIASYIGASTAKESGDEAEVQSFVARTLPPILRGAFRDAVWTARKTDAGIEDRLELTLDPEIAPVISETLAPSDGVDDALLRYAPADATSVTVYNLKNPQIAWRSILLTAQKLTDPESGRLIAAFSNSFFEPYGIADSEAFLSSAGPKIMTVRYDEDDNVAVVARVTNTDGMKKAFDQASNAGGENAKFVSIDGGENIVLRGQAETAQKCMVARDWGQNLANGERENVSSPAPSALTFGIDHATGMLIAGVLSERKDAGPHPSRYRVETRFTQSKMERRLVSEFGLISSIIAMFASD